MSGDLGDVIIGGVESVTAKWAKQRKAEERHAAARRNRREAMTRPKKQVTIREAAWQVMEAAYMEASANDTLPANARQVMYKARPKILALTGKDEFGDSYFTQVLLPGCIAEHGLEYQWDVVYDGRGHFTEPHRGFRQNPNGASIPLSTLAVREYPLLAGDPLDIGALNLAYPTSGPEHRYAGVLFIEKEGFLPLLAQARIADRYDLAIISTKGMSIVAARALVDRLCSGGVPLYILRDFDKAGFSIAATLTRDTRRYTFRNEIDYTDFGLRIEDIRDYGLPGEPVVYQANYWAVKSNLEDNGATAEEVAFLVESSYGRHARGRRVELNAFASDQFIEWLEAKLDEAGMEKVVPDAETLATAWQRARMRLTVNRMIAEISESARDEAGRETVPDGLAEQIRQRLDDDPAIPWDEALAQIAKGEDTV